MLDFRMFYADEQELIDLDFPMKANKLTIFNDGFKIERPEYDDNIGFKYIFDVFYDVDGNRYFIAHGSRDGFLSWNDECITVSEAYGKIVDYGYIDNGDEVTIICCFSGIVSKRYYDNVANGIENEVPVNFILDSNYCTRGTIVKFDNSGTVRFCFSEGHMDNLYDELLSDIIPFIPYSENEIKGIIDNFGYDNICSLIDKIMANLGIDNIDLEKMYEEQVTIERSSSSEEIKNNIETYKYQCILECFTNTVAEMLINN